MVGGRWSVVGGRWSVVGGAWSVVGGLWSVGGRWFCTTPSDKKRNKYGNRLVSLYDRLRLYIVNGCVGKCENSTVKKNEQNYCAYIYSTEAKRANFQNYVQFMRMRNQTKD